MTGIASGRGLAMPSLTTGGCGSIGSGCVYNPSSGNLMLHLSPPAGDSSYVPPVMAYNSTNASASSEVGNGWSHSFRRQVEVGGSGSPIVVTTGAGQNYTYTTSQPLGGQYTPAAGSGAVNSLFAARPFFSATETAPDGTVYNYGSATGGLLRLQSIQNPAGALWTVSYDSSNRVSSITDPFSRSSTFAYNGTSAKISSFLDFAGRRTTFTVNSAGNLTSVMSPELCVTSLVYDSSNRAIAWINPLGDTTSYGYDSSNRLITAQAPLGQVTSFVYNSNQTVVTNPRGYVTTLNFNSMGSLSSAIDGAGNLTSYAWDTNNRLTGIVDPTFRTSRLNFPEFPLI